MEIIVKVVLKMWYLTLLPLGLLLIYGIHEMVELRRKQR